MHLDLLYKKTLQICCSYSKLLKAMVLVLTSWLRKQYRIATRSPCKTKRVNSGWGVVCFPFAASGATNLPVIKQGQTGVYLEGSQAELDTEAQVDTEVVRQETEEHVVRTKQGDEEQRGLSQTPVAQKQTNKRGSFLRISFNANDQMPIKAYRCVCMRLSLFVRGSGRCASQRKYRGCFCETGAIKSSTTWRWCAWSQPISEPISIRTSEMPLGKRQGTVQ